MVRPRRTNGPRGRRAMTRSLHTPVTILVIEAVYLHPADKYHRLTRRPLQGQKGLEERALIASL